MRAGFRALNAGGAAACLARLAPDFAINLAELPGSWHGREAWLQGLS